MNHAPADAAPEEAAEVERKYDVPGDLAVPDLASIDAVAAIASPVELDQTAIYLDTPDLRLLHAKVTLRRRTGGVDDGWHLKLPASGDARRELRLPPGEEGGPVPDALLDRVRVHVRDSELRPTVTLRTHRTVHRLLDAEGQDLAELCDDRVEAETADGEVSAWREWELELVGGDEGLLDAAEAVFLAAGASRSEARSKVGRVVQASPAPWRIRQPPGEDATAGEVLMAYVAAQLLRIEEQDMLLRGGDQEGVHQLRVGARRLRSALATYESLLEPDVTPALREELKWLGLVLAGARDAQVLRGRLVELAQAQSPELLVGPVVKRLDDELAGEFHTGRAEAMQALSGERYFRLLGTLEALLDDPPFTGQAARPARKVLPRLLARDRKRLMRRDKRVRGAQTHAARDAALHEVRKAAKRLRYAGESAKPVLGHDASQLASRAEDIQEVLGELQDTVVSRTTLREIGMRAHLSGENGFTFGLLYALEQSRAEDLVAAYPPLVKALPRM